jgi:E3 ubiquitin-protein ligase UBR7
MTSSDPTSTAQTELTQDSISALEYITQQEELGIQSPNLTMDADLCTESSARDILPYSFRQCTAPLGPLRQALYACLTCSPLDSDSQHGGICYSCSIQCHGSHNLVELFCKRDFTCDCGTTRMGSTPCSLRKVSQQKPNSTNVYNHNFAGRFCSCDQVYDVDAEEGTMFQCLVCEDWFHEKCIGEGRVPDQDDFEGFVCQACVGKNEWLGRYVGDKTAFMSTLDTYPEIKVDIETTEATTVTTTVSADTVTVTSSSTAVETTTIQQTGFTDADMPPSGVKRSISTEPESTELPSKRVKLDSEESSDPCKWASLPEPPLPFAMFLKENFRDHLCRCLTCQTTRLRNLPMIAQEEENYEPDEDISDTGTRHSNIHLL